jgi:8-oxo-dGTP pyrophosphatase MutT (NUDIX family)
VTYRPPTWPVSIKGVAVDAHGRVLLLKNERHEWELPGGRLETGDPAAGMRGDDSPEQALEREILEETGWEVKAGPLIVGGTWIYEPIPGRLARQSGHAAEAVAELWPLPARLEARIADGHNERDVLRLLARTHTGLGVALGNRLEKPQVSAHKSTLEQFAGHDDALDLVGALVDLGDRRLPGSFRR